MDLTCGLSLGHSRVNSLRAGQSLPLRLASTGASGLSRKTCIQYPIVLFVNISQGYKSSGGSSLLMFQCLKAAGMGLAPRVALAVDSDSQW